MDWKNMYVPVPGTEIVLNAREFGGILLGLLLMILGLYYLTHP